MILWAHGLEGSPNGAKVTGLRQMGFEVTSPDGRHLPLAGRLEGLLAESARLADRRPVLAGSSYGGLASAWLASAHPERFRGVLLLAPALHYSEDPVEDVLQLRAPAGLPVHIIHGLADAVVPVQASRDYIARSPGAAVTLEEVDDGHSLVASLPRIAAALHRLLEA
jgi:pimeloyl-ACP methyl ester carboxylesterase